MKKIILMCLFTLFCITSAHAQTDNPVITPENAPNMIQLAQFGDGLVRSSNLIYAPTADSFALSSSLGVWLYDASNPDAEPFLLNGHSSTISNIEYSPDGQFLASAAYGGIVHIWHIPTRTIIQTLSGEWYITGMRFTADSQSLIIFNASIPEQIHRVSIETGQVQPYNFNFGDNEIYGFALHPSENILAIFFDYPTPQLSLWSLDGNINPQVVMFPLPNTTPDWQIAFSADGSRLMGVSGNGIIAIWDVATASLITTYQGHDEMTESPITKIIPSADSTSFLTFNAIGTGSFAVATFIKKWSSDGELLDTFELEYDWDAVDAVYSADAIRVIGADYLNNRVYGWDWSTGEETAYHTKNWGDIADIALSPDGEAIAVSNFRALIFLSADTLTEQSRIQFSLANGASAIAYAPDGRTIATLSIDSFNIWDVETGDMLQQMPASLLDRHIVYSPNGQFIAVGGGLGDVHIWDIQSETIIHTIDGQGDIVSKLLYLSDGTLVVAYLRSMDGVVWNPVISDTVIPIPTTRIQDMILYPDGKSFITLSLSSTIHHWSISSDTINSTFNLDLDELGSFYAIAYHPDATVFAVGTIDGEIIILDPQNPQSAWLHTLDGHTMHPSELLFSLDGTRLYSISLDGTLRMWGVPNS